MAMGPGSSVVGNLETTLTCGVSGPNRGFSAPAPYGSMGSVALTGGYTVRALFEISSATLTLTLNDPNSILNQSSIAAVFIGGTQFLANAASFSFGGTTTPTWSWASSSVLAGASAVIRLV